MDERETIIREQILDILRGGHAHMPFAEAVKDFPMDQINTPFPNGTYSAWGLLEHIRINQWDILDFSRNPDYKYIKWPEDYWPGTGKTATPEDWRKTCEAIESDMKQIEALLMDPETDLYAKIAWGEGQTVVREMLVVADHNAYHLGELAIIRQVMNNWGPDHQ